MSTSEIGSCRVENPFEFNSSKCPSFNTTAGLCGIFEDDYFKSREVRMWTRAKDLLYGYAVIWTFMCLPRLYFYVKKVPFRRLFSLRSMWKAEQGAAKPPDGKTEIATESSDVVKLYHDSGCPICLASVDEMEVRFPVVGCCGHAMCAECFAAMWNHRNLLIPVSCPLCIAPILKIILAAPPPSDAQPPDSSAYKLDQVIRRYNLIFSGSALGILPVNHRTLWNFCVDAGTYALRIGYFFVMFDRKMMNTVSFFVLHFFIAIVVEYFENAYLQSLLEHL